MIPKMTFIGIDGRGLMQARIHPDRCVLAKRSSPDSRVNPVTACGVSGSLGIEGFRASLGITAALLGEAALALVALLISPAD
jgi:hypothetical protein